jgi:hypothetical protein
VIHTPTIEELRAYAAPLVERQRAAFMRRIREDVLMESGHRSIGGGAPQLPVTLAILPAAATVNTFTTAQSLLHATAAAGPLGPYSVDYFKTVGATWQQEAAGVISTTATPTFIMGTYFGVAVGTITTVLCVTPTLTTASGLANFPWYYSAFGHTRTVTGATATILVQGMLVGNVVVLGNTVAGQATQYAVNATPPTAVTADLSTSVYIDLKGTWSASSASNTTTVNMYKLTSLYS